MLQNNTIETLPVKQALSAILSRCERCGKRRPYLNRKWCRPCIFKWQRSPERNGQRYKDMILDPCPSLGEIIPPLYEKADLSDLPEKLVEAFLALPEDKGMYLWGDPGRGKTHAASAFARHLWKEGWMIVRLNYEMLLLQIRDTFKAGSGQSELDAIKPLLSADKLIVEDVGVMVSMGEQEKEFSLRIFENLLNERIEHYQATFITSNKCVEEMSFSFDQRVASRLRQACEFWELKGKDRRIAG